VSIKCFVLFYFVDVSITSRCDWVFVGVDDPKSKIVILTKAEMVEANHDHLLSRKKIDFSNV
jgi:hypothetical protein